LIVPLIHNPSNQWVSIDIQSDSMLMGSATYETCLATDDGYLLSGCENGLCRYESFDDLNAGTSSDYVEIDVSGCRFTAVDGLLYRAQGSDSQVDVLDLSDGALIRTIEPETWSGWTDGIGVAGDTLYLIHDVDLENVEFSQFDLNDGSFRDSWEYSGPQMVNAWNGLLCWE